MGKEWGPMRQRGWGLTYGSVHLLHHLLQGALLLWALAPLAHVLQEERVPREPLQGNHQQVPQLQPTALLVPLTPL